MAVVVITGVRANDERLFLETATPDGNYEGGRVIDMQALMQSSDPAVFLACEIEMALSPKLEVSDVD